MSLADGIAWEKENRYWLEQKTRERETATEAQERLNRLEGVRRLKLNPEEYAKRLAQAQETAKPIVRKIIEAHKLWARPVLIVETALDGSTIGVKSEIHFDHDTAAYLKMLHQQVHMIYHYVFAGDISEALRHIATE